MLGYDEAFNTRYGPAAAYATVLFIYVAAVAYVFVKLLGADVIGEARASKPKKNGKNGRRNEVGPGVAAGAATGSMTAGGGAG